MRKGISLVALTATITIMIILITTVTISGSKMANNSKKSNFATEISNIQKAVDSYLEKNQNEYPVLDSIVIDLTNVSTENKLQFTNNGDTVLNNKVSLFRIDYDKLNYTDLKYGNEKNGENDIYVLSGVTGRVYYAKGFVVGSKVYYTLTEELEEMLKYKTTDTIISNGNEVISYSQEDAENSNKKVTIKIPKNYVVTSVKVGNTSYSATTQDNYYIYQITGNVGTIIDIIYTYKGKTVTTSYTIKVNNETNDLGYVKDGLILHYDAINNTGAGHSTTTTTWTDLSGNGNDAKLVNFNQNEASGWKSSCISLDGIDDYGTIADSATMKPIAQTIEIVFNRTGRAQSSTEALERGIIFVRWYGYTVELNKINNDEFYVSYGRSSDVGYLYSTKVLSLNKIYSLTTTHQNNISKLYLNSKLNSTQNVNPIKYTDMDYTLIGKYYESTYTKADIYSIRMYNRALTQEEVIQNYNIDKERFGI